MNDLLEQGFSENTYLPEFLPVNLTAQSMSDT